MGGGETARWLAFQSEASKILSASLDYRETLASIARLCVPTLADWCDIRMLQPDGALERATIVHRDPAQVALAEDYARHHHQLGPAPTAAMPHPLVDAQPQLIAELTDEVLCKIAPDPDERARLRAFGLRSSMRVPLIARRRTIGLMVLCSAESGRIFTEEDLAVATDLASRAAMAVDNARLYAAEQKARAQAEAALAARTASEQQLRAVLDHSPALIFISDVDGRLMLTNPEYARRTGIPAADLIGRTVADFLPREQAERIAIDDRRIIVDKRAAQIESAYLEKGELRHWFTLKFPIVDDEGVVRGLGGIATDVTERKRAAEALARSQERFEKVFRSSPISITINALDDGRLVDVNPACEALTGYSREEMIGRTDSELGVWVVAADRVAAMATLRAGGVVKNLETRLRDKQGRLHDVLVTLELTELSGRPCILALALDVTDQKQLRERLERAQRMEALGRLAGGIAHDFNNILTAIRGYTGLLLADAAAPSPLAEAAEHIRRAADRAAALTDQLLVFGRSPARPVAVVDVNAAVESVTAMLGPLIGEDVRLEIALAPDAGSVEIDPAQLDQLVLNLALNARDAMPGGGRLRIETAPIEANGARLVRLRVDDEGVGIDEATHARMFEPFFTTKDVGKGSGLGLATVYGIVEKAGGRIAVRSEPGRGACFDILLPRAAREPTRAPPESPPLEARRGRETLLVVEDDDSVREFVCLVLRQADYTILTAADGDAALAVAAEQAGRIDLLVTDVVMPRKNGRALADELRRLNAHLRVVYMSGYPGDTIRRYDEIPAGDAFLQKPFTREQLLAKVTELLATPRA